MPTPAASVPHPEPAHGTMVVASGWMIEDMAHRRKSRQIAGKTRGGNKPASKPREPFSLRVFIRSLGPGLITGASDDDPSGIGTYSQAGAQLGYGIGWTMLLSFPLMAAIQEISARVARGTGHGSSGDA